MFQTKVEIPFSEIKISYQHRIMTLGSCFAENIGRKMNEVYFDTVVNPFGVLYNPISIQKSIEMLLQKKQLADADIFEYNSLWQSFSHSTLFTDISAEGCLNKINLVLNSAADFFTKTNVLLLTFGSAWIFEDKKSGSVVSNCHKLPASNFTRRRLEVNEIVDIYSGFLCNLLNKNPDLQIILSVSPIRHWKDGATENTISKSTLLLAVNELQEQFENVHYFPAYEIQMDELRDYRFYAADMLHPSDVAVDYIWKRFAETYFDKETLAIKKELEHLAVDLAHRPLHPDSEASQKFMESIKASKKKLQSKYPFLIKRL
ncbi:MAG: GSCFA domain-containing protein [Paludibacter sp.]|nr:GSCFA domain-containing protein [Paludibacter sp.]